MNQREAKNEDKDLAEAALRSSANAIAFQSTSENSPEESQIRQAVSGSKLLPNQIPRVVIRHRNKGAKKEHKRFRKNEEQNKILLFEF